MDVESTGIDISLFILEKNVTLIPSGGILLFFFGVGRSGADRERSFPARLGFIGYYMLLLTLSSSHVHTSSFRALFLTEARLGKFSRYQATIQCCPLSEIAGLILSHCTCVSCVGGISRFSSTCYLYPSWIYLCTV